MSGPLKSGDVANYQSSVDPEESDFYEEDWLFSERTKRIFIAGGILVSGLIVYLFCIVLPDMFIPELRDLTGIPIVQELDIVLKPVDPKTVGTWNFGERAMMESDEIGDEKEEENEAQDAEFQSQKKENRILKNRMILVGDIHGELKNFKRLLQKLKFERETDQLIILGDFVSKGPDSLGVIELLAKYDAECVLGNHEYYVLDNYARFHGLDSPYFSTENTTASFRDLDMWSLGFNFDPEYLLAKKLQPEHVAFINKCLLIKRLGSVPLHSSRTTGGKKHAEGLAVHAGLILDALKDLNEQDPTSCLEMRSYLAPHFNETTDDPHEKNAVSWSKVWNSKQKEGSLDEKYVVYYGHDARRGLNLKKWAKGIDSGCSRGEALTAMVIWQEKTRKGKILYKEQPVSVLC